MLEIDWNKLGAMIAPFAGLLLMVNIWFVGRLVKRIDTMDETVKSRFPVQANELKNMAVQIADLKNEVSHISSDFKDVGRLRERIAVLEYAAMNKNNS